MHFNQIQNATLDELTDELAAAGWDSTQEYVTDAMEAVARLLHTVGESSGEPLLLVDSETTATIRAATEEEAVVSVLAAPEGHIIVDGRRCYVTD